MRHENGAPARRSLAALYAILAVTLVFVGLAAVMGPGRAIDWFVTDLLPMVVLVGMILGVVGLMMWEGGKVHDARYEQHSARSRVGANGVGRGGRAVRGTEEGFSNPVYWLLVCLFVLATLAMACFFGLVIYDQWINHRALVAGRFDQGESLRVVFALLAGVAATSGLLWRHYRKVDSYGSPLGVFFAAVFALCGALAAVTVLPALFAG